MYKTLSYDDVALVPSYFSGSSRSKLDVSTVFGNFNFKLPIVPANMKCVIDVSLAKTLSESCYFYVMHRFDVDNVSLVKKMKKEEWRISSISLGVRDEDYQTVYDLKCLGLTPDYITVDIAHGHCAMMKDILDYIKKNLPNTFVIAGNIATVEACEDLTKWGADSVKVGIGPGKSCITKLKTGFYTPMFSIVNEIAKVSKVPVIADGGIQHNGDIAKAIVAGAQMIMAGSIFAQCTDSPATCINGNKVYYGSASAENKGHSNHVEGKQVILHNNGLTILDKLTEIKQDLQSSYSYSGGNLNTSTKWIII